MRVKLKDSFVSLVMGGLLLLPASIVSAQGSPEFDSPEFDSRDLSGVWGAIPGSGNNFNYGIGTPPPPLTQWGMENLRLEAITHAAVGDRTAEFTINGVPTNTLGSNYPGKDCEPLGQPANLDYVAFGPMEFVYSRSGDRIIQMLEYHREWRTLWLTDEHPEDIYPSYMGDSIAYWEGNTLVVDTTGFNGLTQLTQGVGHRPSDAFHMVERYTRVSYDRVELVMDMYDEKAWGEGASWSGLAKTFALMPGERLQEFICVPSEFAAFDSALEEAIQ
ncbi:hypothetical protein JYT97_03775 [Haliea sp. AH-315-K21]|uniref:Uncharacterized protein n=1 Tax=SAR86 cluster bacterium TaxID=2030880 RepID=A0A2A5CHB2_9GAMM|nr:hypothetical protein [Haliea sp. AH-315-K21]PCJ42908.1 MAG: hypothetical protein COA71_05280 [SAR86 cluster bacterium]